MSITRHIIEHEILGIRAGVTEGPQVSGIPTEHSLGSVLEAKCDSSADVGDVVYCSGLTETFAYVNSDNREKIPSIGVIITKPSGTICGVQTEGDCSLSFPGLESGKKVWVGTDGKLSTTVPSSGYMQVMGQCPANGKVILKPQVQRTKCNPF